MSRSRNEMPGKLSPRAPLHLKVTACSEATNNVHRSPRLEDRRSLRSPLHEKKLSTRMTDLETKLGQAQDEVKKLKEQLASVEAAKQDALQELEETKKLITITVPPTESSTEIAQPLATPCKEITEQVTERFIKHVHGLERAEEVLHILADDVPEVNNTSSANPMESPKEEDIGIETTSSNEVEGTEELKMVVGENARNDLTIELDENIKMEIMENPHLVELRAKLAEKDEELQCAIAENKGLKKQVEDVKAKEEEFNAKLQCVENELNQSKAEATLLNGTLESVQKAKGMLEADMRRLRVQTDQWRKAAETAAAVLTVGGEIGVPQGNGRQVSGRCGSMDKQHGFMGFGSPMMSEEEDELGGGRRKSGGIVKFSGLWKK